MPPEIVETIGRRLRRARQLRGMTQAEVAKLAGVTFQSVAKYECGVHNITVQRLISLSRALGVEASELVGGL